MNLKARITRWGWIRRGAPPSLLTGLAMSAIVARCRIAGWKRDRYGRLFRFVRPSDPPSALFHGNDRIWFDPRYAGGERVITWSYWYAFLFDVGALHGLIEEGDGA